MKKIRNPSPILFIKKHLILLIILVVLIGTATVGLLLLQRHDTESTQQRAETLQQDIAKADATIAAIKERKAAEAAAAKAKKEAEAAAAAELLTRVDASQAAKVDSTTCNVGGGHGDPSRIDVVVNKKHCMQPLTYAPSDLVTVNGATLSTKAAGSFSAFFNAAAAAGQGFSVTSSYRSFNDQVSTYQYWVNQSGVAGADTYSARPGYSEHQTGLVVDVAANGCVLDCFGTTSQYQWMQANAAEYGFIQRYYAGYEAITGYKSEEWHYRYVGRDVAVDMKQKGIKTLEEYWGISGGNY